MKYSLYSHCDGQKFVPKHLQEEIARAAKAVTQAPARGAATKLRNQFLADLHSSGWSGEVAVAQGSDMTITSMKDEVGLCMQTGNMARMYADLMKLQTLYLDNAIQAAVIVVPSQPLAQLLGDNIAQAKRLEKELHIFKKAYHVPTLVLALE